MVQPKKLKEHAAKRYHQLEMHGTGSEDSLTDGHIQVEYLRVHTFGGSERRQWSPSLNKAEFGAEAESLRCVLVLVLVLVLWAYV